MWKHSMTSAKPLRKIHNAVGAYIAKASCFYLAGKGKEAAQSYTDAIKLLPDNADLYFMRGNAYKQIPLPDGAMEDFLKALAINPDHASALNNVGAARGREGKKEQGCEDLKRACRLGVCIGQEWATKEGLCK